MSLVFRCATAFLAGALIIACFSSLVAAQTDPATGSLSSQQAGARRDGQHDFDFEFGTWNAHLKRLLHPLTGSHTWVELDGVSTVRRLWDGSGNLGQIDLHDANTRIRGLSLRLYNPESHQWSIYWANQKDGALGIPMVGQFKNGRGEFYDQETFQGAAIFVRFIFSDITANSFRLEQAFSPDGGQSWEPNWIVTFTREKNESNGAE